ncbi:hypothetical protein AMK59_5516 [Oryctes borbonicus]|uniref:Uncharacterized protein n=1 Tax=Oryctes borbonicus TaxID=1629725 RepID=A0A0T6B2A9_9SCAR|nr:hypothetical protein AMK59_5516 [Oryctes borbonicus]
MEVVTACPNGTESSPFHNHDVREWSRIDNLTGVLERARRETDHWTSNTNNSTQKYGKVVDCRARSCVDGNLQQEARRQLEVFQSQIPGSRLQVIKTNTVSSSRWTTKSSPGSHDFNSQPLDGLNFNTNLLDVSAQKSKASTGRAVGKRPLSKQLNLANNSTTVKYDDSPITSLRRVSRLCHQIHESAVKQYLSKPTVHEQQITNSSVEVSDVETNPNKNEHSRLARTKSTSSEDLTQEQSSNSSVGEEKPNKGIKDLEDLEALRGWRRTSKYRRSLQLAKENRINTKPPDLPENNGSVRRIREDLEKGRRLNTALRGNSVNLEALDQILQSISNPSFGNKKFEDLENLSSDKEDEEVPIRNSNSNKKNSFVTVESIKEARDRLRRTSSPTTNIYKDNAEDSDDGIVIEDPKMSFQDNFSAKVHSYVYGMDNGISKIPMSGTGSLESRSKHLNGNFIIRNEDWYNRRKSYGFEKMQQDDVISNVKNTESSTDSGICRSSEIVAQSNLVNETAGNVGYTTKANNIYHNNLGIDNWAHSDIRDLDSTTVTVPVLSKVSSSSKSPFKLNKDIINNIGNWQENENIKRHSIAVDEAEYVTKATEPKFRKTSLAINTNDLYLENEDNNFFFNRKPKKVEFCKTEVHFTAESGKVNIVETDEKPPPTSNFRRRRRNSGLIQDEFKNNNLPAFKFGDDIISNENNQITDNEEFQTHPGVVTVTSNINSTFYDVEEALKENIESELPKGILKNKPIKPKPYLLGGTENFLNKSSEDNQTTVNRPWEIKLKPIRDEAPLWQSALSVQSSSYGNNTINNTGILNLSDSYSKNNQEIPEFQKLLMNLKPISKHQDLDDVCNSFNGIRIVSPNTDSRRSSWSVSDRIKHVEDLHLTEGKGYSTKINFGNGETTVIENNHSKHVTRHPTWPRREETSNDLDRMQNKINTELKHSLKENEKVESVQQKIREESNTSPIRKNLQSKVTNNDNVKLQIKKLSSPALVGQSSLNKQILCDTKLENDSPSSRKSFSERNITKKGSLEKQRNRKLDAISPQGIRHKSPHKDVLRQPKKSEMAYFGVPASPKPVKVNKQTKLLDKPDLLQFSKSKKEVINNNNELEHIYENVDNMKKPNSTSLRKKHEFDNGILEELTRAADQILQAVNEYANDESRNKFNTDEAEKHKRHRNILDTISETKSWKQDKSNRARTPQNKNSNSKTKIKQTSSNSSIESVSKDVKRTATIHKSTSSVDNKVKRKTINSDNAAMKANTKARRLQRASSREALLQSHGSSSEDLPAVIEVPLRKHRLLRKTKPSQTESNNTEAKVKLTNTNKKREDKPENRIITSCLPEIRHKTAISTIRSTAEKTATREKIDKLKTIESKKKVLHRQNSQGTSGMPTDRNKNSSSKDNSRRTPTSYVQPYRRRKHLKAIQWPCLCS